MLLLGPICLVRASLYTQPFVSVLVCVYEILIMSLVRYDVGPDLATHLKNSWTATPGPSNFVATISQILEFSYTDGTGTGTRFPTSGVDAGDAACVANQAPTGTILGWGSNPTLVVNTDAATSYCWLNGADLIPPKTIFMAPPPGGRKTFIRFVSIAGPGDLTIQLVMKKAQSCSQGVNGSIEVNGVTTHTQDLSMGDLAPATYTVQLRNMVNEESVHFVVDSTDEDFACGLVSVSLVLDYLPFCTPSIS